MDAICQGTDAALRVAPFWSAHLRKPILLALTIAFFNQMSGINAVLYFAPRIFELSGLGARAETREEGLAVLMMSPEFLRR